LFALYAKWVGKAPGRRVFLSLIMIMCCYCSFPGCCQSPIWGGRWGWALIWQRNNCVGHSLWWSRRRGQCQISRRRSWTKLFISEQSHLLGTRSSTKL